MFHAQSYQLYRYAHGLTAVEQRSADVLAGEAAAALRDLRLRLGRAFRGGHRGRAASRTADVMTASARVLSSVR
jgi:hypothetical protein